jgi:Bacterial mobilisation protein (MobC)
MARPRKGEAREQHLGFRLTLEEALVLRERAARAGQSLSDYARNAALKHRPHDHPLHAPRPFAMDAGSFHQIRRLGVNLNQIAKLLNAQDMPAPPELAPLLAEIRAVLKKALSSYGA